MADPIQISRQTARRFVLGKQGLWPGRRWAGKDGTRQAVIATEHLQLDPLVILARSHDLMLHSRVSAYQPEMFDQLAYGERQFFDWGGWLAVRPMSELPHWRVPSFPAHRRPGQSPCLPRTKRRAVCREIWMGSAIEGEDTGLRPAVGPAGLRGAGKVEWAM